MIRFSVLILCLLICVGCGPQQVTVEDHQSTPAHIELQPPVTIESFVRRGEPFESTYTAVPECGGDVAKLHRNYHCSW